MTDHFDESITPGPWLMSGSVAMQVEEAGHGRLRVEQRLVHVDVDHLGAVVDLLAGDLHGLVVAVFRDQPGEARANR